MSVGPHRNGSVEAAFHGLTAACFEWSFDDITPVPPLASAEQSAVARAVPKRRREFAVGRACAHAALRAIGRSVEAIPRLDDRSPGWPIGVTGSISHTSDYAIAVVASADDRRVGIDVESWGRISDAISDVVSTPDDRRAVADGGSLDDMDATTVVFAAKEAFYKAQYAWTASFVEFGHVRIERAEPVGDGRLRLVIEPAPNFASTTAWPVEVIALLNDRRVTATATVASAAT